MAINFEWNVRQAETVTIIKTRPRFSVLLSHWRFWLYADFQLKKMQKLNFLKYFLISQKCYDIVYYLIMHSSGFWGFKLIVSEFDWTL